MNMQFFSGQDKVASIFLGYFLDLSENFLTEKITFSFAHIISTQ